MSRGTLALIAAALAGAAAYFAAATWLDRTFVDPTPKGALVIQLSRPFERHGYAAVSHQAQPPELLNAAAAECPEGAICSPVVVYEDGAPLGPASSTFGEIAKVGRGRFAHWRTAIAFSATDNSDPNTNGRRYWAVIPFNR